MSKTEGVWVLEYIHRHGSDISVHETPELAWKTAVEILLYSLDEIDGDSEEEGVKRRNMLRKLARDGEYQSFCAYWSEFLPSEAIDIDHVQVNLDEGVRKIDPQLIGKDELVEEDDDTCDHCGGSGGGPDEALKCPFCSGKGTRE